MTNSPDYEKMLEELVQGFGCWFGQDELLAKGEMSNKLYPYRELFKPIMINKLKVKNRIVMGSMGNISMAEEMGRVGSRRIQSTGSGRG